ncbi:helix-turn-helix transcriptional regulator [Candidatus Poseidoniales archaeon]|nr:helix-turn-helix transcriptional regulator [Candidatus Poseidoniales archaeon]|tara:strand:- start:1050 stop:1379 length:330 start_codon:yes stop_codon:yes gene_type:complete
MEQVCDPVFARVDQLLALLTKSKLLHILYLLNSKSSSMRFSDIKKSVDSSSTTITRRLKELEDNGLIIRTMHPTMPVTVSYELTEDAKFLAPTIQSMYDWIVERDVQFI